MTTEDSVQFSLRYAGPETENHLINASELARSLLGLSSAVDAIAQGSLKAEAKYMVSPLIATRAAIHIGLRRRATPA